MSNTKILYIEDNTLSKILARQILEKEGFEVLEAGDGLAGVNLAISTKPDLILMDMNLPGLDGYEASTRLKSMPDMVETPIIAFTGRAQTKDDQERIFAAGCDGFISKESSPNEFLEQIQTYLQGNHEAVSEAARGAGARAYQQRLVQRLQDQVKKLTRANEELTLLNNVAHTITSTLNLKDTLNLIMHQVEEAMEVEACSLLLLDEETGELVFEAASGIGADQLIGVRLKPGQGIAGWVAREAKPALVNDVRNDTRFFKGVDEAVKVQTQSIICVPLLVKNNIIGVLEALNKNEGKFDQESIQILDSLASTAVLAIENARLYTRLQNERDQLIKKEEEIRRAIARDLHDGPTQLVSAMSMSVEYIKNLRQVAPDKVDQALDSLQTMANEAAHDIRNLLFGLHPTILETQGLVAALEIYVERFTDRKGMKLTLDLESGLNMNIHKEAEIIAFIIIQEAVNNARKHANASETVIKLRHGDESLLVTIQDDGRGFDMAAITDSYDKRLSFGLTTMSERAQLIEAGYDLKSQPGQGTTIKLKLPLGSGSDLIAARLNGV